MVRMTESFASLGLPAPIVRTLKEQGIETPFPIQAAAIPDALAGKDILGRGPTGSGKTFTFGLPMLTKLARSGASKPAHPRGLVLVPTRELAAQVRERLDDPAASLGLRILDVVGGVNIKHHIRSLAAPVDLLVATPGRAQDLIDNHHLYLDQVIVTALDEADQMADMGFLPQVTRLLRLTPASGQRLLFSATLDNQVEKLVQRFLSDPVTHATAAVEASVETMTHYRFNVGEKTTRNIVVERIAARSGKTIMFMRTKHGVDRQVKKLRRVGINAAGLHGDKGQGSRTNALAGFSDGSVPVLVATDIAARGIDIGDVDLVVHVDPPAEHKAYLHRAGRTARAGARGAVVTLVTDEQMKEVDNLLSKAGVNPSTYVINETSPELIRITGAKEPTGRALPAFGAQVTSTQADAAQHSSSRRNRKHGGDAHPARRNHRSGRRRGARRAGDGNQRATPARGRGRSRGRR